MKYTVSEKATTCPLIPVFSGPPTQCNPAAAFADPGSSDRHPASCDRSIAATKSAHHSFRQHGQAAEHRGHHACAPQHLQPLAAVTCTPCVTMGTSIRAKCVPQLPATWPGGRAAPPLRARAAACTAPAARSAPPPPDRPPPCGLEHPHSLRLASSTWLTINISISVSCKGQSSCDIT